MIGKSDRPKGLLSFQKIQQFSTAALTVALCIISVANATSIPRWADNLLTYAAGVGIIACGMTFVMIAGGFDLSVGSIAAVCGVVAVIVMQRLAGGSAAMAIGAAVLAALAAGIVLGAINGMLIAYIGVNPFVVTLSTMFVFRGIGLVITSGGQSQAVPVKFADAFARFYWGGLQAGRLKVSIPLIVFAVVFLACLHLLRLTRLGHYVYATGGNARASWLAGINTKRITAITYVLSGLVCAIAALLWTALSNTAQASSYQGKEMIVIASVIVGGTPLGGGRGGLFSTLCGLLLLCTIEQLLTQFGVDPQYRLIVTGLIIVAVVAIDASVKRATWRSASRVSWSRILIVALALAALIGGATALAIWGRGQKKVRIGFAMTLSDPYWQNMRLGAIDEARKFGATVTILNADEDVQRQSEQVKDLITQGVDVVCLVPMKPDALVNSVRELNRAKIPAIIVNREIDAGCDYVAYTGTDTYAGGVTSAGILMKAIGGEGKIAELQQVLGTGPQLLRTAALNDVLKDYPKVEVVARIPHEGNDSKVVSDVGTLLAKYKDLKGIYVHGDPQGIAAARKCKQEGRTDIAVVGMGGSEQAIEAIRSGLLTGTSYQQPEEEGRSAIRLAIKHLRGEKLNKRYPIDCPPITKDNAHKYKGQF